VTSETIIENTKMYPSETVEQALCESVLERLDITKIDPLIILQLESRCNHVRSFPDFCMTLTRHERTDPVQDEMQRWQNAFGLSNQDMQELSDLPFGNLLVSLQNRNLDGIFAELDRVNQKYHE
jgi:hypothetical protein